MKIEIEEGKIKKEFKPFTVKIEVETIQEARLLYHVFNRRGIGGLIFDGFYGRDYCKDIDSDFDDPQRTYSAIKDEIKNQGFEI